MSTFYGFLSKSVQRWKEGTEENADKAVLPFFFLSSHKPGRVEQGCIFYMCRVVGAEHPQLNSLCTNIMSL